MTKKELSVVGRKWKTLLTMLWMAPAAAAVAKDRGGIAIIAIRILHKRERERESSPLLQGLLCNGYRTIQIAQFKLKENEQENNKWILYIDSVDIAIQCLLLLNYKSSGHWITRAIAFVIQYPITFENQKWMDLEIQEVTFSHFWVTKSRTLSFRGFANTDVLFFLIWGMKPANMGL